MKEIDLEILELVEEQIVHDTVRYSKTFNPPRPSGTIRFAYTVFSHVGHQTK